MQSLGDLGTLGVIPGVGGTQATASELVDGGRAHTESTVEDAGGGTLGAGRTRGSPPHQGHARVEVAGSSGSIPGETAISSSSHAA